MGDLYREILVSQNPDTSVTFRKAGLIALTALLTAAGILFTPVLLLAAVVAGGVSYYLIKGMNVEYEYLYVNGDLDIDRIRNKERRKRVASYDLANLQMIAPSGSHDLDGYKGQNQKTRDFTSKDPNVPFCIAVYRSEGKEQEMVFLELDDTVIRDMQRRAPHHVSRDFITWSRK